MFVQIVLVVRILYLLLYFIQFLNPEIGVATPGGPAPG
jgi:hypothetical protein